MKCGLVGGFRRADEVVGPREHGLGTAREQQDRGIGGCAEGLVADFGAVVAVDELFGGEVHGFLFRDLRAGRGAWVDWTGVA